MNIERHGSTRRYSEIVIHGETVYFVEVPQTLNADIATQTRVDKLFMTPNEWHRKAVLNVAGMGTFSADRTIRDYAVDTWNMGSLLKGV